MLAAVADERENDDAGDEGLELLELPGVNARNGRFEQLLACVAEQVAAGRVRIDEPVLERIDDEGRIARVLEKGPNGSPGGLKPA